MHVHFQFFQTFRRHCNLSATYVIRIYEMEIFSKIEFTDKSKDLRRQASSSCKNRRRSMQNSWKSPWSSSKFWKLVLHSKKILDGGEIQTLLCLERFLAENSYKYHPSLLRGWSKADLCMKNGSKVQIFLSFLLFLKDLLL